MKLEKVLDNLNSWEKNSFVGIMGEIISKKSPKKKDEIDKIFSESSGDLKSIDNANISRVFGHIEEEFEEYAKTVFANIGSQYDLLTDIISRDGNCIMKEDWFSRLYEKEIKTFEEKKNNFINLLDCEKCEIDEHRKRDYIIYKACLLTAYNNDLENNLEQKITSDEQSILRTLSSQLGLSQEEVRLINYTVIPLNKLDVETAINNLKNIGFAFYSKKLRTVFVADEIVKILRKAKGKEVADKFFRRVLLLLREPQINLICKRYNIDRSTSSEQKIKDIIRKGISFSGVLINDMHKDGTKVSEKKTIVNELCEKGLKISPPLKGVTLEDKVANLISYFENIERDEKVSISLDGYEKLLIEIGEILPSLNQLLKTEFELQEENVLSSNYLLDYNIKPKDVLEIISEIEIKSFCEKKNIKTRGDIIDNILDTYKDAENLYIENYENIGFRNLNLLKENGITIKESDLGVKFEELTKTIFTKLGLNADEALRKKINTSKDKIDLVLNMGNNEVIIVECKTVKECGYNKFSSVSRQLKSYIDLAKINDLKVIKSLLVAPDFSDEFIKECGLDYELNLSLLKASTLVNILNGFKNSKLKHFPHNLLMRDVLIQEDRVLKAIDK